MADLAPTTLVAKIKPARLMIGVTAVTGVLGWVCLIVAGRQLGPAGYARFSIVWGVLFGLAGSFSGLQQEVTRATHRARPESPRGAIVGQAAAVALAVAVVAGALIAVARPAGLGATLGQVITIVVILFGFASMTFVNGVLSQREEWPWVAAVLTLDSVVRTIVLLLVLSGSPSGLALALAIGVGPFAWLLLLGSGVVRDALVAQGSDNLGTFVWRASNAMLSAVATSGMVAGFPFLLALTGDAPLGSTTGSLLAGLVLVRSPLLLVVFGLRPVLLRSFLGSTKPTLDVTRLWTGCLVVAIVGGILATAVGSQVLGAVMGEAFQLTGWQLASLLVGCVFIAMLTVSGLALIALDRHIWSTGGWVVALVGTLVLLSLPLTIESRIMLAINGGPVLGLGVHALGLMRNASVP